MADLLEDVVSAIDRLAAAEPAVLADGDTLVLLHAQLARLDAVVTRSTGVFDAGGEWAADGARSAAAWLSTRCRLPKRGVQRRVHLARALRHMPATQEAWVDGRMAEPHAALLARARDTSTAAYERDEPMLVDHASALQHRHLDRVVAYWRQLAAPEETEHEAERDHDSRRAHLSSGLRGTGFLDALFDPIGYAIFEKALAKIENDLFEADWADARARLGDDIAVTDLRRTPPQRRCDALVEMARRAQALPPGARLPDPLFTVRLDVETAARVCELEGGAVVTPGSLAPWVRAAWIERVVLAGPDRAMNIGVRRRLFTGATRRAVEVQHTECFHEFCDVPVDQCQIDHIEPYAAGGLTVHANGRPACAFHNRQRNNRPSPRTGDDEPP